MLGCVAGMLATQMVSQPAPWIYNLPRSTIAASAIKAATKVMCHNVTHARSV